MFDKDKPAAIHIFRYPFEMACEVVAHSLPIQRLKLNFDNTKLFSVGEDGVIGVYQIVEREVRKQKDAA